MGDTCGSCAADSSDILQGLRHAKAARLGKANGAATWQQDEAMAKAHLEAALAHYRSMDEADRAELKRSVRTALEGSDIEDMSGLVEGLGAEDLLDLLPLLLL